MGKTHTADELHARLIGSFVADPEELGFALTRLTPPKLRTDDVQDHPLWRPFVLDALSGLARRFPGLILVPMTLTNPKYHRETIGGLRVAGIQVEHVSLLAPPEVVRQRLRSKGSRPQAWDAHRLTGCLEALSTPQFAQQSHTAGLSVPEVAEAVAEHAGLGLAPRRGRWHATWAQVGANMRHIRRQKRPSAITSKGCAA